MEEAPNDGNMYVRQSGQWVKLPPAPVSTFQYRADVNSTTASDPGTGKLRWNNADQLSATELYFDRLTQDGFDISLMLLVSMAGDKIAIQRKNFALDNQIWQLLGPAVQMADWFKVPVQFVSAEGNSSFSGNQEISVLVR